MPAASSNSNRKSLRRCPDLPLPLSQQDSSFTVPPATAPSSSTQLSAPVNLSELERINRIGSGSGSTVYKVLHRPTGRIYALKVIYGNHEDSVRLHLSRQIEILRNVDNPNVIRCHDLIQQNGEIQVLLEYMDKGSLEGIHIPDKTSLSEVTRQILSGLYYLHRRKIVHRDIKPSNLLINSEMAVKIADFRVSMIFWV